MVELKIPLFLALSLSLSLFGVYVCGDVEGRRNKVAEEILTTEQSYVNSLRAVVEVYPLFAWSSLKIAHLSVIFMAQVFLNPLRDPSNKQIVTQQDLKGIFSEIEVILGYNAKLLAEIEARMKNWSFDHCLGDIFGKIVRTIYFLCTTRLLRLFFSFLFFFFFLQ